MCIMAKEAKELVKEEMTWIHDHVPGVGEMGRGCLPEASFFLQSSHTVAFPGRKDILERNCDTVFWAEYAE
jgi:hypothetical protein